ncbi:MAG: glucoamylase family protein, partial [Luteimonas sp.]
IPLKTGRLVPDKGWVASDYIGIDQGPILAMIANYRNGFVWEVMKRNQYIQDGLIRAGFTGGWLKEIADRRAAANPAPPAGSAKAATPAKSAKDAQSAPATVQ